MTQDGVMLIVLKVVNTKEPNMSYEDYFKRVEEARETELEQSKNIVGGATPPHGFWLGGPRTGDPVCQGGGAHPMRKLFPWFAPAVVAALAVLLGYLVVRFIYGRL